MIRVLLADDHHLVRQALRALLERAGDIMIVGEASDGYEALELVQKLAPDVLVLDIGMPKVGGIQVLAQLHEARCPAWVVVLSMYSDDSLIRQALRYGARGYLLKRSVTEELLLAIRAAARQEFYLSPLISAGLIADALAAEKETVAHDPFERLSSRERQILQLIAEGHTNAEVARQLNLSAKTVEKHRASLMAKLGVHDLPALIRVAIRYGLVGLDQ